MTLLAFALVITLLLAGYEADLPLFSLHGFLSILFPYILLASFIFFLFGVFFKRKIAILMLLGMALCYSKMNTVFTFSFPFETKIDKGRESLKILSWNVRRLIPLLQKNLDKPLDIIQIKSVTQSQKLDVICLIDFAEKKNNPTISIEKLKKSLGMKYHFFHVISDNITKGYRFGNLILSRFEITRTGGVVFDEFYLKKEGLGYADLKVGQKTIRTYIAHFQSFGLNDYDYNHLQKLRYEQEFDAKSTSSLYMKMSRAFSIRNRQILQAKKIMAENKLPKIICTDLNDVPNSFAYNELSEGKKDAFAEKGNGIGRTFLRLLPTLRIDYIFVDTNFKVHQFQRIKKEISDHYPIISELSF